MRPARLGLLCGALAILAACAGRAPATDPAAEIQESLAAWQASLRVFHPPVAGAASGPSGPPVLAADHGPIGLSGGSGLPAPSGRSGPPLLAGRNGPLVPSGRSGPPAPSGGASPPGTARGPDRRAASGHPGAPAAAAPRSCTFAPAPAAPAIAAADPCGAAGTGPAPGDDPDRPAPPRNGAVPVAWPGDRRPADAAGDAPRDAAPAPAPAPIRLRGRAAAGATTVLLGRTAEQVAQLLGPPSLARAEGEAALVLLYAARHCAVDIVLYADPGRPLRVAFAAARHLGEAPGAGSDLDCLAAIAAGDRQPAPA